MPSAAGKETSFYVQFLLGGGDLKDTAVSGNDDNYERPLTQHNKKKGQKNKQKTHRRKGDFFPNNNIIQCDSKFVCRLLTIGY